MRQMSRIPQWIIGYISPIVYLAEIMHSACLARRATIYSARKMARASCWFMGFGPPSNTFEKLAPVLVQAGYRVLVYDLFGRGFSDAPPALYDEKLHTMQLYLLLKHVGWTACSILGFSMGGGIAACFAQQYPHMVDRLILVAPAGVIDKKDLPWFARMTSLPYIGYVFSGLLNKLTSIHAVHQAIVGSLPHDSEYVFARSVIDQVRAHKGFTRALTSSMHYFPFDRLHHVYDAIGKQTFPVMTIWTSQDEAVHYPKCADRLRWHIPRAEEYVVWNARHSFIHSHGEQIGRMIATYNKE